MAQLNIGGSEDAFFRYKMPDIQVKIEGRGNGIKTVLPNIADIGQAIKRDPQYPTKFFAIELGALSQWDKARNVGIVNGAHNQGDLKRLLAEFIEKYVLCPKCRLPETDLKVKDKKIHAKCKACGWRGLSDNIHRVATFIVNHPPVKDKSMDKTDKGLDRSDSGKDSKSKKERRKDKKGDKEAEAPPPEEKKKEKRKKKEEPQEEEGMKFEITEEMENMHIDKHAELDDPVEVMGGVLAPLETASVEEKVEKIRAHQKEHEFDASQTFQYVFKALVTDSLAKQVKQNIKLFEALLEAGKESQWLLICLLEERIEAFPNNVSDVAATLLTLYDTDLVEEETILVWHEKGTSSLIALADQGASNDARKAADKFVEWLKTAEEEDSDEEEDDE